MGHTVITPELMYVVIVVSMTVTTTDAAVCGGVVVVTWTDCAAGEEDVHGTVIVIIWTDGADNAGEVGATEAIAGDDAADETLVWAECVDECGVKKTVVEVLELVLVLLPSSPLGPPACSLRRL